MYSELLQFVGMLVVFAVTLFLWLKIVYLPRRTLERWKGEKVVSKYKPRASSGAEDQDA